MTRVGTMLGLAAALALAAGGSVRAQTAAPEYAVKATFLYKFAPFVTWPLADLDGAASPLLVCVVGEDPFGAFLDQAVAGQKVDQHPITIRRMKAADRTSGCHILYLGGSPTQSVAQGLAALRGAHVLTVTDAANGGERGVVHFVVEANRVRFHVDDQAAAQNGLAISSKLLSLALSVRPRAPERR